MAQRWGFGGGIERNESLTTLISFPHTMSLWFKKDSPLITRPVLSIWKARGGSADRLFMGVNSDGSVFATTKNQFGQSATASGGTYTANVWNHLLARFSNPNARTIYLNPLLGIQVGSDSTVVSMGGMSSPELGIGHEAQLSHVTKCTLAEIGIWNSRLESDDIKALARGASPILIKPETLISWCPLVQEEDLDFITGVSLTQTGTALSTAHPSEIVYPQEPIYIH